MSRLMRGRSSNLVRRAAVVAVAIVLMSAAAEAAPAGVDAAPRKTPSSRTAPRPRTRAAAEAAREDSLYALWRPLLAETIAMGGEPRDVYKLIYQGVMGPAHAVPDRAQALADLRAECNLMDAEPAEGTARRDLVLEPVRPDSQLVRVNLWPLLRRIALSVPRDQQAEIQEEELEQLAAAFVRTAGTWEGDLRLVRGLWRRACADRWLWTDRLQRKVAVEFTAELAKAGWPAAHHSERWTRRYRPHYRVVSRALVPASWAGPIAPLRPGEGHAPGSERPRRGDLRAP